MADNADILEHEILKALYLHTSLMQAGYGTPGGKSIPIFVRDYSMSMLHFGTLVDVLNNPEKYKNETALQSLIVKTEDINIKRYNCGDVSSAIELLSLNRHVEDKLIKDGSKNVGRTIKLTYRGAIDFKSKFYYKEREKYISILRSYDIQKKERWLKEYWILVEILKYVMGGIIGAAITLLVVRISGN